MLTTLENGLFAVGQILRVPVMTLLWLAILAVLFMAAAAATEFITRRRERRGFSLAAWLKEGSPLAATGDRLRALPTPLRTFLLQVDQAKADGALQDGGFEHLVLAREEQVRRTLQGPRVLVKVGPSLGLLGTLIPMGTSLASLATGNLQAMAGQMVVAFTTTIVGLAVGTLAFGVTSLRQTWVAETIREQRFLAERIAGELAKGR